MGTAWRPLFLAFAIIVALAPPARPEGPAALPEGFKLEAVWLETPRPVIGLPAAVHRSRQAKNEIRVLHVGAHPDDEHSGLVAWLARAKGWRVAYLSGTRGEGGQNSLGPERGPALALLRTEELLAARRLDGGEQRFLNLPDFGFSKTSAETLEKWGHEEALRRLVAHIREFKPKYIVSCFLGDIVDGHGHHQAMGLLSREAFRKAADPTYDFSFGVMPWQADALLASRWRLEETTDLTIDLGVHDPVHGLSAYQIAARGRSMHKSQDMGMLEPWGPQYVQLRLLDLAEGVSREEVLAAFDEPVLEAAAPDRDKLIALWNAYASEPEAHREGLRRVQSALHELGGPHFELVADRLEAVADEPVAFTARVVALDKAIRLDSIRIDSIEGYEWMDFDFEPITLQPGESAEYKFTGESPRRLFSQPNFLIEEDPSDLPSEPITRWRDFGPEADASEIYPPLAAEVSYHFVDENSPAIALATYPVHVWRDPIRGERREQFRLKPEILGRAEPDLRMSLYRDELPNVFGARRNYKTAQKIKAFFDGKEYSNITAKQIEQLSLEHKMGIFKYPGILKIKEHSLENRKEIYWSLAIEKKENPFKILLEGLHPISSESISAFEKNEINYAHISNSFFYENLRTKYAQINLDFPADLKIAYVQGAGDDIPPILRAVGVDVTEIPPEELASVDWNQFDTAVLGIRAYEFIPELVAANERLMDWVREGGTVVVQYNKYPFESLGVAPYPVAFHRPHDRVTDENAEVSILAPDSPILNYPNKIGSEDFAGWVQERSLYCLGDFDESQYAPILSAADPGEEPKRGMLVEAKVGEGRWIYSALALFRQVPEGVPGGVRLMVNLAAQGRYDENAARMERHEMSELNN